MASRSYEPLALYVHWPFCQSKCPYCDFNSHVRLEIDQRRWREALLRELESEAEADPDRRITSIFFGGGTPSLMLPETAAAIIEAADRYWGLTDSAEITIEANPSSVEIGRLRDIRAAGVNRISLGVQSFDDDALDFLGRAHSAGDARTALDKVRSLFSRYSFDLIYSRPDQSVRAWKDELAHALEFAGDHLSLYQLTIERGTAFFARHRDGAFELPDDETAARQFEHSRKTLENAGLKAYEISNHAEPGGECRHNLAYWRYQDYVGIGPGAHGRVRRGGKKWATRRIAKPENWLNQTESQGDGLQEKTALTDTEIFEEMTLMGLRLAEGLNLDAITRETGARFEDQTNSRALDNLIEGGFLAKSGSYLKATPAGAQRLNAVTAKLLDA
ncbi:MAG: coproporphyrinogen III oxidase [Rhodospirillaceae bacterium]|nr:coproporphyrinogen III oxidase [Rhodospirillaceae bacterium]HAA91168.1 coproporphyrinogen III oxidase [Rhodospirillaceae bacterium]